MRPTNSLLPLIFLSPVEGFLFTMPLKVSKKCKRKSHKIVYSFPVLCFKDSELLQKLYLWLIEAPDSHCFTFQIIGVLNTTLF